jgi:hypothetical protein
MGPMRPLVAFFRCIPGGSGRSIPFPWWVARQAGMPVICSTTQPYSNASNQTLTGKGMTRGKDRSLLLGELNGTHGQCSHEQDGSDEARETGGGRLGSAALAICPQPGLTLGE